MLSQFKITPNLTLENFNLMKKKTEMPSSTH